MLLIMEEIEAGTLKPEDMVTASERAKSMGGSTIFLDTGESMSVHDMLKGIAVASANDACVAMAEHIAGSEEAFVKRMNEKALTLGMKNTSFKNTNGLDAEGHYSSARDIAIMSAALLKYPKIKEYTTIWMDSLREGKFQLANTNKLIRFYKDANGLKTGSTNQALYCLSGSAERDGMQLVAVIMAAPTSPKRFSDASKLLDYGFANFQLLPVIEKNEVLEEIFVEKGSLKKVPLIGASQYRYLCSKNEIPKIEKVININEDISAPILKGETLGNVRITVDGTEVGNVELVAAHSVEKLGYFSMVSILFVNLFSSIC